jgi:hypothetical protein
VPALAQQDGGAPAQVAGGARDQQLH